MNCLFFKYVRVIYLSVCLLLLLSGCVASANETPPAGPWALEPPAQHQQDTSSHREGVTPLTKDSPAGGGQPQQPSSPATVQQSAQTVLTKTAGSQLSTQQQKKISPEWEPLISRLKADGLEEEALRRHFRGLEAYSSEPMAVKIKELYRSAFVRTQGTTPTGGPVVPARIRIYKGIVTQANVDKCNTFLLQNKAAFDSMEKKYGIPRETIVALLFVETKLGVFTGKEKAFWSLASMASATSPELVKDGISSLPLTEKHDAWLQEKLKDKSNWAYKEVKALLVHCTVNDLDPQGMPGSVYGAIGICQFMPSNLVPYGADGNNDGKIDLFDPADAIHSTANYLKQHGWGENPSVEKQRLTLKRYNNLLTYANTILTLAESVKTGVLQTAPPDAPKKAATGKKAVKKTPKTTPKEPGKKTQKGNTGKKTSPKKV